MTDLHDAQAASRALAAGPASPLRAAIADAKLRDERACVRALLADWSGPDGRLRADTDALARKLVEAVRAKRTDGGRFGVDALMHAFRLDAAEGVALMCIAEALLRIPDAATRDALIRDRLSGVDWTAGLGRGTPVFVHAAAWGLLLGGRMLDAPDARNAGGLAGAARRVIARGGEPVVRRAMDVAMRLLGERFVAGRDIGEAIDRARPREAEGWRFSYDMLGEAAITAADATRYFDAYRGAITAIAARATGDDIATRPGLSVKLSALHPRYQRAQRGRVLAELGPRLLELARAARDADIGLNVDAEEADRLELSLDLFEQVALHPSLAGFGGLGFVVQAYGKRAPFVIDWLDDLAKRRGAPLMVRLVKGAYWDAEIRRAQADGLEDYPVFTRKAHTDLSWLVCAHRLLRAADRLYPQFATHNAHSLATVDRLARAMGEKRFEFQCLHGMGEALHEAARAEPSVADRACRVYAPVGDHETLLPYLVRRLLENGANSSFVHRLVDADLPVDTLLADPFDDARHRCGAPHPQVPPPPRLHGERLNSRGFDVSDDLALEAWRATLTRFDAENAGGLPPAPADMDPATVERTMATLRAAADAADARSPATTDVDTAVVDTPIVDTPAVGAADTGSAALPWPLRPAGERAAALRRAADAFEAARFELMALLVREAGKTLPNAVGEVREAVDFLRWHAEECERHAAGAPLGVAVCISPWNFPLAIFVGQVSAALAAGNTVAAKPAEQTPRLAARAVALLHGAGVPADALALLPGDGERVGAALVADARTDAVLFTGSTEVARHIGRALAALPATPHGERVLVAETGGQNAMFVDASALPEQVVQDAIASAFDSAGQRCSALRVLCVQDEIADRVLELLRGAMAELRMGDPGRLETDVGPVIDAAARDALEAHVARMQAAGLPVHRLPRPADLPADRPFVAPALVELDDLSRLQGEVFGPVLHVLRWKRDRLDALLDAVAATGYALTLGVQSRVEGFVRHVAARVPAGNVYVNRNIIGAVVAVQPFGGEGLSGTGPKAGGPLGVPRLQRALRGPDPARMGQPTDEADAPLAARAAREVAPRLDAARWLADRLAARGDASRADAIRALADAGRPGLCRTLHGPAGERNLWMLLPRGTVRVEADGDVDLLHAAALALATGNRVAVDAARLALAAGTTLPDGSRAALDALSTEAQAWLTPDVERLAAWRTQAWSTARGVPVTVIDARHPDAAWRLLRERTFSVNLAASGGDPALMSLSDD